MINARERERLQIGKAGFRQGVALVAKIFAPTKKTKL